MKKITLAFLLIFILAAISSAHQPRLVYDQERITINKPEISKAFYGELKGGPITYKIDSKVPFKLYVGLLVPDLKGVEKDISAKIYFNNRLLFALNGQPFKWKPFYEEFGGDNYYSGPERTIKAAAGSYLIKVFSPDNKGKYVLAVGDKESFPPGEIFHTLIVLPQLKPFFEKSPLTGYFNIIGIFFLIMLITFVLFVALLLGSILFLKKRLLRPGQNI